MDCGSQYRVPDGRRHSRRYIKAHSRKKEKKVQNNSIVKPIFSQKLWEAVSGLELLKNNRKQEQNNPLL